MPQINFFHKTANKKKTDTSLVTAKKSGGSFSRIAATEPFESILEVRDLTKHFGSFVALDHVSFAIHPGDRVAVIGANGAGKTTLVEIIAGLAKASSGSILYGYKYKNSPQEGIGMQFQKSDYPSGLSVRDMINFAVNLRKIDLSPKRRDELLKIFQMSDFYRRKASKLSGGQKQKLNILMSVLHEPKIIIMDELSTGLDILAREEIIRFTDQLLTSQHISALIISHHFGEIERLCNKVIAMDHGKITRIDTIENLRKEFGSIEAFARAEIRAGVVENSSLDVKTSASSNKAGHSAAKKTQKAGATAPKGKKQVSTKAKKDH